MGRSERLRPSRRGGHLANCVSCHGFEASARTAETALSALAASEAASVDWWAAEARIRRDLRRDQRNVVIVLAVLLLGQLARAAAGVRLLLFSVIVGVICVPCAWRECSCCAAGSPGP